MRAEMTVVEWMIDYVSRFCKAGELVQDTRSSTFATIKAFYSCLSPACLLKVEKGLLFYRMQIHYWWNYTKRKFECGLRQIWGQRSGRSKPSVL